jgi:hypothetical protein
MLLYIQLMSNPWLDHVAQWRKQYGNGLTYKQVLIEARKSYTPIKKGSGYVKGASRPPPPSGAQQAATRARMAGSGFKDLPKNLRKPARDADRFLRENIKQPIRKAFDPSFRTKKDRIKAQEDDDKFWRTYNEHQERNSREYMQRKQDALRLEALEIIGADDGDSYETIRKKYKRMSLRLHPDRQGGNDAKFQELNNAMDYIDRLNGKTDVDFDEE